MPEPDAGAHHGIIVGVDGSSGSRVAVQWAARDAQLRNVPLTLVHVLPAVPGRWLASWLPPLRRRRKRGRQLLDEALQLVEQSCARGRVRVRCEMPCGLTVPTLTELSRSADMVVVGCLGTGTLRGRHLGSVSAGLVYHAKCPVAILHGDLQLAADLARAPVLVGIDGAAHTDAAIAIAFDEASRRKVDLSVVHAWKDVGVFDPIVGSRGPGWPALRAIEDEVVAERLAGWGERYPDVHVNKVIARGDPARQLVENSQWAQLVVVGNRGGGGFAGVLMGSVSAAVTLLAHVPVIVAHDREHNR